MSSLSIGLISQASIALSIVPDALIETVQRFAIAVFRNPSSNSVLKAYTRSFTSMFSSSDYIIIIISNKLQ